jgi:hypothetical protein
LEPGQKKRIFSLKRSILNTLKVLSNFRNIEELAQNLCIAAHIKLLHVVFKQRQKGPKWSKRQKGEKDRKGCKRDQNGSKGAHKGPKGAKEANKGQ